MKSGEYYKHWKGEIYYIICEALMCQDNNTQERYVVYKQIDKDQIFIRHINEFEEFVDTEEGERLRRFKKIENNIPNIPYKTAWLGGYDLPSLYPTDGIQINYTD